VGIGISLAYAFRLTLAVRLRLLVSAAGQTEKGGTSSPAGLNGSRLRKAKARSAVSRSSSTHVK